MKHLHERMDDLFANGTPWQHRTLRTLFDSASSELNMTIMDEKSGYSKKTTGIWRAANQSCNGIPKLLPK